MIYLLNDTLIKAISWTLIHSIWMGFAVAILAGLTLLLTKKATSTLRYNLLATLSIAFLAVTACVFYHEFQSQQFIARSAEPHKSILQEDLFVSSSQPVIPDDLNAPFSLVTSFISQYGSWIVFTWFVVFVFKCIRMTGNIREVYRARNYQTSTPPDLWRKRVSELQASLRIKRSVQLLESKLVSIPSVTGFFKPVILVPVGLLNHIPREQVEAILLHELAHIRRSDYAVNMMQTFIEILFFFNPGILWISSLLRDERENCCDDLAIGVTNNKKEFVHALISFQEYSLNTQQFAMQFGDQKMKLANRAKRILFNSNKILNTREKYFLSVCSGLSLMLFLVVLNVNTSTAQEIKTLSPDTSLFEKYHAQEIQEGSAIRYTDYSNGKQTEVYVFKHNGVVYLVPEDLEQFMVDGKLITGKDRESYLPQIKDLIAFHETNLAFDISEQERIIDEAARTIDQHSEIIDRHSLEIDAYTVIIDEQLKIIEAETRKKEGEIDWEKYNEAQRRVEAEQLKIDAETAKIDQEVRKMDEQMRKIDAKMKQQEKEMETLERLNAHSTGEDITKTVIEDLKKAGYTGKINSFELSEKVLIINGKKQPETLFQKVKKHSKPGLRIMYHMDSH